MHKSRLGAILIDCHTQDLQRMAEFWSAALGGAVQEYDDEGLYVSLETDPGDPRVLLQKVEHPSRVHLDIETDDIEAEVRRLEGLGASVVEVFPRWTVMQAPSGHRFCIISAKRKGFDSDANTWD